MRNLLDERTDQDLDSCLGRFLVPEHNHESLSLYLRFGIVPGGFLLAVLRNDLRDAYGRADDTNKFSLFYVVQFLEHCAPDRAWGSPEAVNQWIAAGVKFRTTQNTQRHDRP